MAKAICRSAEERAEARGTDPVEEVWVSITALTHDTDLSYDELCEVERYCMAGGYW